MCAAVIQVYLIDYIVLMCCWLFRPLSRFLVSPLIFRAVFRLPAGNIIGAKARVARGQHHPSPLDASLLLFCSTNTPPAVKGNRHSPVIGHADWLSSRVMHTSVVSKPKLASSTCIDPLGYSLGRYHLSTKTRIFHRQNGGVSNRRSQWKGAKVT